MIGRMLLDGIVIALIFISLFALPLQAAQDKTPIQSTHSTDAKANSNLEQGIIANQVSKKRNTIIQEAAAAITHTKNALLALEHQKKQDALDALEKALGELEVVLLREPDLGLAAIDTQIIIYDLYASLDGIAKAKKQVMDYLEEDEIQKARSILDELASEVVVSVTNIPLKTYPKVIKDVIPLIDAEQFETAKTDLETALNSLTVMDYIIPLPFVRTDEYIDKIEVLTEKPNRTKADNDAIVSLLADAHLQLEIAEALGYGNKKEYQKFHQQLDEIEDRVGGIVPGSDYYDEIRKFLADFLEPFDEE